MAPDEIRAAKDFAVSCYEKQDTMPELAQACVHVCRMAREIERLKAELKSLGEPKPPTRKVVQRLCVLGATVAWGRNWGNSQEVEFEITPDRIVGVRLVEGDE